MSQYCYDGLRDAYHLIQENEKKKKKTITPRERMSEVYAERYGYRTTATTSRRVARDEPDTDEEQLRQSDAIRASLEKKKKLASRERLKAQGKVPVKQGKKIFETFMKEATEATGKQSRFLTKKDLEDIKQLYLAARNLDEFDKFLYFINEVW